jgi:O-methyltransferase
MFYVPPEHAEEAGRAIETLRRVFGNVFAGDMMIVLQHNTGFYEDARFMDAFNAEAATDQERSLVWRLHILCWCARTCLRREGDFVECGVYRGFSTGVAARYLGFGALDRRWFLYDTFDGIPPDQLNPGDASSPAPYAAPGLYEACLERFAAYGNVRVVRGRVPEVLRESAPAKVAFLHLDMNSAAAETAALEYFAGRLSPGAMVLLDDYGWTFYRAQKLAADAFFARHDRAVVELPTGQGLVLM